MPHYYVNPSNVDGSNLIIEGPEAYHLIKVLKIKLGSIINLFDGTGKIYKSKVIKIEKNIIKCNILESNYHPKPNISISIYQSVPKGNRFEWLIEKSAELGIRCIHPLICERNQIKTFNESKLKHWQRISLAASKQSNRSDIMKITEPINFENAVKNTKTRLRIIPWEAEKNRSIKDFLKNTDVLKEVDIFIGPEGGFTPNEIELAKTLGMISVSLGSRILRVETASLLTSILILNFSGEYSV